ncbi:MAG: leucine-rich repeat domain-containing protein [Planktothrix sp.]|uniref:leucine-rich repeat domain-containing protein n=1 Tax=Planktothrix sp. TaxID=3088171 RepID=UPI0038D3BC37
MQQLTQLITLDLYNTKVSNSQPLESLTNLTGLDLRGSPLTEAACPVKTNLTCRF